MIQGILFDLGETLLDFGQVDIPSLFEAGIRSAYTYLQGRGKKLPTFSSYHHRQLWAIQWNYFKSKITGREFNSIVLLKRMARRMGHELSEDEAVETAWLLYEPLGNQATIEPGLLDLLASLRDGGLKLGLISNTFIPGVVLDRHLRREGLLELLPVRVYSSDVGYRKPHRRIFARALQLIDLPAGRTLLVGDSPSCDIKGAGRMGMTSVLKDPAGRYDNARIHPDYRIRTMAELPCVLSQCETA